MTVESTNSFVVPAGTKQIEIAPLGSTKLFQPLKLVKIFYPIVLLMPQPPDSELPKIILQVIYN